MRITKLFGKTQRETPSEADTISHQLLLKAAMIHQITAGVYSYLPLAWRALKKIENIIREEMDKAGGQEVRLPALQPVELWPQSGRHGAFGETLFALTHRRQRKLALGPTHEEVVTELVSHYVQSYRDLPLMLYQIQTKFRDEPRPRGGLIRTREFDMMDLYSFDTDSEALDIAYNKMLQAYDNIYNRCGLPTIRVEADSGAIGGKDSHEFMVITETGEDEIIHCPSCKYSANVEKAQIARSQVGGGEPLPLEEIATPGMASIEEVSSFLKIPPNRTLKAVFYIADGKLVFVVIRGDIAVNEVKLKNTLHCAALRIATEAEVKEAGIIPGAASPIGIRGIKVVADDSITTGTNFVAGANKPATHFKNANYPRDFQADIVTDIARAAPGDACPKCGEKLVAMHGVEVGQTFKLGISISQKMGANFVDQSGVSRPIIMGCYGIGLGRLMGAAIEQNHDEKGIVWPLPIAPYHIHLCALYMENPAVATAAESLYTDLTAQGFAVLFDDRAESPGVKFNDADLLGMPVRVTISPRTLEKNSVEVKRRTEKKAELVSLETLVATLKKLLGAG